MPDYYCESCGYKTHIITHYKKHLGTKKHLKCIQNVSQMYPNVSKMYPNVSKIFQCKYCDKVFKYSQGLSKHIKYTCKKNKDEDIKELVRLLNEQNEQNKIKDEEIKELKKSNEKQLEIMKKQIDKLSNKLQIQQLHNNSHNNNNNNIVNFNNNIQLLNYKDTDYSHISNKTYHKCVKHCFHSVKSLINEVHFNNKKPENKNIYISNIKNKYIMVYKDNKWQLVDRKEQLDDLYSYNEVMLEEWYDEYKDKYPDMIKSFTKYLNNRDNDVVINKVKEEIILMMYNNRHMIENNDIKDNLKIKIENNNN